MRLPEQHDGRRAAHEAQRRSGPHGRRRSSGLDLRRLRRLSPNARRLRPPISPFGAVFLLFVCLSSPLPVLFRLCGRIASCLEAWTHVFVLLLLFDNVATLLTLFERVVEVNWRYEQTRLAEHNQE